MNTRKSSISRKRKTKKPVVKRTKKTTISGTKTRKPSRKKLLDELIMIEKEGQIYNIILRDARLKKEPEIVKSAKAGLRSLARRQNAIFKAMGIL